MSDSRINDPLAREVYGVFGLLVDRTSFDSALALIELASRERRRFLLATPNVNYLVTCGSDPAFRSGLYLSDLCPPDGMPIIWLARLLGTPIRRRIAGSDIFDALRAQRRAWAPLKVFLFGAADGVAAAAARVLNAELGGVVCVGSLFPQFGTVDEMSTDAIISQINDSGADFLVVALGALKGQLWLARNHHLLTIPVRAHLGAVVNFIAGRVRRAPPRLRRRGLEWLWRIAEEPQLWARYWSDGKALLRIVLTQGIPLALEARLRRLRSARPLSIVGAERGDAIFATIEGDATATHVDKAIAQIRPLLERGARLVLNFDNVSSVDARFIGLLMMMRMRLLDRDAELKIVGAPPRIVRIFALSGFDFLITHQPRDPSRE